MTSKYGKQASLGLVALGLVALPMFLKLPYQFTAFKTDAELETQSSQEQSAIKRSEELERARIGERAETGKALNKAGVMPTGQKLKIRKYYYNPKHDPRPETTGFNVDETVFVYDSAGVCVGAIQQGTWKFKGWFPTICNYAPKN